MRTLVAVRAFIARSLSGSHLLSLAPARSRRLDELPSGGAASLTDRALAVGYGRPRRTLAEGAAGEGARRLGGSWTDAVVGRGRWVGVAGAWLLGLGVGWAILSWVRHGTLWAFLTGLGCALLGLIAVLLGPAVAGYGRASLAGRLLGVGGADGATGEPTSTRRPLEVAALVLAGFLGLLSALATGVWWVMTAAAAVAVVVAVVVLYRPEILLLVLAAFPWVDFVAARALGGRAVLAEALILFGGFVAVLFSALVTRRWDLRTVPLTLPLLVAFVLALASVTFNPVPVGVAFFALRLTFQAFAFYYLAYLLPKDVVWIKRAVAVFLAASALLALHGLYQYVTHAPMPAKWVDVHESIGTRAYSIVENPNGLGAYLLLGTLLALRLVLAPVGWRWRLSAAGLSVILGAGLAVTFSRGAWIGFFVGAGAMLILSRSRWLWALVCAVLVAPLVAPASVVERATFAFSSSYLGKSAAAGRLYAWRIALERLAEHPLFGVGLGTFGGTTAFLFGTGRLWVDNYYLQLAAEGGLLLLAAFLWILVRAGKGLVVAYVDQRDPFAKAVAAGVFGGFVAVAVANVTASVWETFVVASAFWSLVGMASSMPVPDAAVPLPWVSRLSTAVAVPVDGGESAS